jgi:hypothetical protein
MTIRGFFKHDAPFVNAHLFSPSLKIDSNIEFLIDTGASRTVLLDRDIHILGIDVTHLKKHETDLCGIGGCVATFLIEDSVLVFKSDQGEIAIEIPVFVTAHSLDQKDPFERSRIFRMPSILGRDVINLFKLVLSLKEDDAHFAAK